MVFKKIMTHHPSAFQLGLFGITDDNFDLDLDGGNMGDSDGADSDLEAELAAITSGGSKPAKRQKPKSNPVADLDAMIAESLKDIPSDEELSGDDDEFLSELQDIAGDDEPKTETSQEDKAPEVYQSIILG